MGWVNPIKIGLNGTMNKLNLEGFIRKDIRINDYVWVKRAGDVIPYISKVDLNNLIRRVKEEEKRSKRQNLVISAAALSAVAVFGIILTL